jgi:hypothetical protein
LLLVGLPEHLRLLPSWIAFAIAAAGWLAMASVSMSKEKRQWLRLESAVLKLVAAFIIAMSIALVAALIRHLLGNLRPIGGFALLTSSVAVWVGNVLGFSLLYWLVDRGGPLGRDTGQQGPQDWLFPQAGKDTPNFWQPTFVDYLFLSFSTATAFSAADTLPLTAKAKLLTMLEAAISLVTLVVVAARAINVLGS